MKMGLPFHYVEDGVIYISMKRNLYGNTILPLLLIITMSTKSWCRKTKKNKTNKLREKS